MYEEEGANFLKDEVKVSKGKERSRCSTRRPSS